jgi:hypothetical protein
VSQDRPALQALREWLARAALPVQQDRLAQLDNRALQVLLARRGLPDFPALLGQMGLLGPKDPQARKASKDHKVRRVPREPKE